jgi:hypothetical protein
LVLGTSTAAVASDPWRPMRESCAVNGKISSLFPSCSTGFVQAHPTVRQIWMTVAPYSGCQFDWIVRDGGTGNVISSGRTYGWEFTINMVQNHYRLEVTKVGAWWQGCGGDAVIRNYY